MRPQMGLEPCLQFAKPLPSLLLVGWEEGASLSPGKDDQSISQPPLWPTAVSMQSDQRDYQGPLKYFLFELEKQAPWKMKPLVQPRISSTDSKLATFLTMQSPSMLGKTSHQPGVSVHSFTGSEQEPSGHHPRKGRRKREKRMKGRDADVYGGDGRQEPLASLAPQVHGHNCPYWGYTLWW